MVSHFLILLLLSSIVSFASLQKNADFEQYKYDVSKFQKSIIVGDNRTVRLDQYLDLGELEELIVGLGSNYSSIVRPVPLLWPSAVGKKTIWAVQISRNVWQTRKLMKPMVKLVANIHGNDAVGYALMTSLMQYLTYSDGHDTRVSRLLNTTDIWIIPTMNPDGFSRSQEGCDQSEGETNGEGVDLNENFLDPGSKESIQPETQNMLDLIKQNEFVLSANLQGGAIVASYPYDYSNSLTPDDGVFKKLAKGYAERNWMMAPGNACNRSFPGGIANGRTWKKNKYSMQDANYILSNCFELTLYLSCCKYPPAAHLPMYWDANLEAMLSFIDSAHQGIYGKVVDVFGRPIKKAVIDVINNDKGVQGTDQGEYWRLLGPGHYVVTARAPASKSKALEVNITHNNTYVQLDFQLARQGVHGRIVDAQGEPLEYASIRVDGLPRTGRLRPERSDKVKGLKIYMHRDAEYWKYLPLGEYTMTATAPGHAKKKVTVELSEVAPFVQVDFKLETNFVSKLCGIY